MFSLRKWRAVFGDRQLSVVESLLKKAINNQEKLMTVIDDLKAAVKDIADDVAKEHDEIMVALEHIVKSIPTPDMTPDVQAAVDSLKASHATITDSLNSLKTKVDSVLASGGSTT